MARRKLYVSRDGDRMIKIWYGKPAWVKFWKRFNYGNRYANRIVMIDEVDCVGKVIWPLIKPCELKPGECVEIKIPKLELIK